LLLIKIAGLFLSGTSLILICLKNSSLFLQANFWFFISISFSPIHAVAIRKKIQNDCKIRVKLLVKTKF